MPEQQGSSFIPKSGVTSVKKTGATRRIYLLAYVSYIIFFTTLFVVVGVYIYSISVNRSLVSVQNQLTAERQRFAVSDIEQVRQLDKRIKETERMLNETAAPSRILSDIETIVSSDIFFTSLSYELLPNRQFELELTGRADDFNQVLSQRELLKNSNILRNAVISKYDYSVSGENQSSQLSGSATLSFTFSDVRDSSLISYVPSQNPAPLSEDPAVSSNEEQVIVSSEVTEEADAEESEDNSVSEVEVPSN